MAESTEILSKDIFEGKEGATQVTGRELGLSELMYNILLHRAGLGIYYHVGVFESTTEVTEEQFRQAFRVLVNFQPLLRMKISPHAHSGLENNPRQYFESMPVEHAIDIKWVNLVSTGEWTELMEKEKSANIQPEIGPLWRTIIGKVCETQKETQSQSQPEIKILKNEAGEMGGNAQQKTEYVILFYIHHGIVEGVSCFDLICNQFLPILNAIVNNKPPEDVFLKPLPLPPTLENVLLGKTGPTDINPPWYMKATLSLLRWKNRLFSGIGAGDNWRPLVFSKEVPNDSPNSCFAKLLIPAHTTSKFINECRHYGVGVHSGLLTAFSYATAETMKEFGTNPDRTIKHNWPVDLRKFVPELTTPHTLGYFASGELSEVKLPESFEFHIDQAWSFAKKLNKSVKAVLSRRTILSLGAKLATCLVDQIINTEEHALQVLQEIGFRVHFSLSNLGNCDAVSKLEAKYPHFVDLRENYFGVAMNDVTHLLKDDVDGSFMGPFIGALTFKGCMNIAVGYSDRWMSREFIKKFLANTEVKLNQMCE